MSALYAPLIWLISFCFSACNHYSHSSVRGMSRAASPVSSLCPSSRGHLTQRWPCLMVDVQRTLRRYRAGSPAEGSANPQTPHAGPGPAPKQQWRPVAQESHPFGYKSFVFLRFAARFGWGGPTAHFSPKPPWCTAKSPFYSNFKNRNVRRKMIPAKDGKLI